MLGRLQEILALRGCLEEAVRYHALPSGNTPLAVQRGSPRQLTISFLSIATNPKQNNTVSLLGVSPPRAKWLPSSEVLAARVSLSDSLVSASDL